MLTKYTLTIDRLTVNLQLNSEKKLGFRYISKKYSLIGNSYSLSREIELRKTTKRLDKYFTHSFEVWLNNTRIGYLHTDSRLPQAEKLTKFEFSNCVFYSHPGFLHYLHKLQSVGLFVTSIIYCEIALDIQLQKLLLPRLSFIERHSTLDKNNPNPKYRPLRAKTVISKLHNGSEYIFGNKKNGKTIAVYNKSEQLVDSGEKDYIRQYHQAHGLDVSKPIERIEARISNTWFADNHLAIDESDLAQLDKLKTLFIRAVGDCFKFIDTNAPAKPQRNAQGNYTLTVSKDLLPLGFLQSNPVELTERWQTGEDADISDNRKRTAYRALVDAYISQGTEESLASLNHFAATQTAPKKATWQHLTARYAMAFEGTPTPENKLRIEALAAYIPSI